MSAMMPFRTMVEVARQTACLLLQNRIFRLAVVLQLGTAGIAFVAGASPHQNLDGVQLFSVLTWWVLAFVVVPWTTLYFSTQAVHGDIEDRTFQYLFVRPVRRSTLLLGKWLGVAVATGALHLFGVVLVHGVLLVLGQLHYSGEGLRALRVFAEAMLLLAASYSAVGCWFAARFRWPLVWGGGFVIGAQMLLASLPVRASIRQFTITDPVRRFVLEGLDPDQRLARMLWPVEREWRSDLIGQPLLNLGILTAIALLLALASYCRREYDSRQRE